MDIFSLISDVDDVAADADHSTKSSKHKLEPDDKPSTSGGIPKTDPSLPSKKSKIANQQDKKQPSIDEKNSIKSKSIQSDPTSSKVFKSLFTTSETAKAQPRAHWVTYNPLYY